MKFSVIIPIWDREPQHKYTVRCANDLMQTEGDFSLVFIDNASPYRPSYDFLHELAQSSHRVHFIANDTNLGYAAALNQGLYWSYNEGIDYYICCNNDIYFLRPDWWVNIIKPLQQHKALVGRRLIPNNEWVFFDGEHHHYLEGYMLGLSRQMLEDVGYFDEIFSPAWVEDVEYSWRAQRRGYLLIESPHVPIFHVGGQTGYRGDLDFMGICAQNVEKFKHKVRNDLDGWVGPPTFRSKCQE